MTVAVDTNIIFDLLLPDPKHVDQSLEQLNIYSKKHSLVISEIVYGELTSQFHEHEMLLQFFSETSIRLVYSGPDALWAAARASKKYTKSQTQDFQCKDCGKLQTLNCKECKNTIVSRQHILPDFLIGGHALFHAGFLLTRDRGFYKRYFPELELLR